MVDALYLTAFILRKPPPKIDSIPLNIYFDEIILFLKF